MASHDVKRKVVRRRLVERRLRRGGAPHHEQRPGLLDPDRLESGAPRPTSTAPWTGFAKRGGAPRSAAPRSPPERRTRPPERRRDPLRRASGARSPWRALGGAAIAEYKAGANYRPHSSIRSSKHQELHRKASAT